MPKRLYKANCVQNVLLTTTFLPSQQHQKPNTKADLLSTFLFPFMIKMPQPKKMKCISIFLRNIGESPIRLATSILIIPIGLLFTAYSDRRLNSSTEIKRGPTKSFLYQRRQQHHNHLCIDAIQRTQSKNTAANGKNFGDLLS